MQCLAATLDSHGGFRNILAFRPTGWSHASSAAKRNSMPAACTATRPSPSTASATGAVGKDSKVSSIAPTSEDRAKTSAPLDDAENVAAAAVRCRASVNGTAKAKRVAETPVDAFAALMQGAEKRAKSTRKSREAAAGQPPWLASPQSSRNGRLRIFSVPYSEHSSFTELCEFVRWLRPVAVVPTVNQGVAGKNVPAMLYSLAGMPMHS
jgi:hypothetical protein